MNFVYHYAAPLTIRMKANEFEGRFRYADEKSPTIILNVQR